MQQVTQIPDSVVRYMSEVLSKGAGDPFVAKVHKRIVRDPLTAVSCPASAIGWQRSLALVLAKKYALGEDVLGIREHGARIDLVAPAAVGSLLSIPTVFWRTEAVEAALSMDVPSGAKIHREMMKSSAMCFVLQSGAPCLTTREAHGAPLDVMMLTDLSGIDDEMWKGTLTNSLGIISYGVPEERPARVVCGHTEVPWGSKLEEVESIEFWFKLLAYMNIEGTSSRADFPTRKKSKAAAAAKGAKRPNVSVVSLPVPPRTHHPPNSAGGDPVDWSCRWLVSGHYRLLPGGRITYVKPYVKGPANKPFRPRAYDVRRR